MEKRKLGNSELYTSVIGFGAWAAGKTGWGQVTDTGIEGALRQAYELGVNFFDTAPVYGFGESEIVLGRVLKPVRDNIILATKIGLRWDEHRNIRNDVSRENIVREVEESLRRLNTDYIDLYQVHWPDPSGRTPLEETFEALNDLVEQQKIRYIGVSNFSADQLQRASELAPIVSLQSLYNVLQRDVEQAELPLAAKKGIGFIPYSPIAQGLLTGKFNSGNHSLASDDYRQGNPLFTEGAYEQNLQKVEVLKEIAARYNKPVVQVAINWLISSPAVSTVIVGAKDADQVQQNVQSASWSLSSEDIERINQLIS